MKQSKTISRYKCFKDGRTSVDDDECSGWPSTSTTPENIAKGQEAILADHRQTIHNVCEIGGLSYGTIQWKLKQARDDPNFISNIITGDWTQMYGYDPEAKQQLSQWKSPNSPRSKKACHVCSNVKFTLIIFSTSKALSTWNLYPLVEPSIASFSVRKGTRRKCPDKWKNNNWFLHHNNAPAHTSLIVRQFLTSKNITVIPPPPYSPDLTPCNFFLFPPPKMKLQLKGHPLTRLRRSTQNCKRLSTHSH